MKSGGRPGRTYHVMRATADIMFSLLTSGFVLSTSLFFPWIQFVLSVQFVLRVRLLLDQSWLCTVRDVSHGTHHVINPSRPSPAFHTASDKSWAWRPGNEATSTFIWQAIDGCWLVTLTHCITQFTSLYPAGPVPIYSQLRGMLPKADTSWNNTPN